MEVRMQSIENQLKAHQDFLQELWMDHCSESFRHAVPVEQSPQEVDLFEGMGAPQIPSLRTGVGYQDDWVDVQTPPHRSPHHKVVSPAHFCLDDQHDKAKGKEKEPTERISLGLRIFTT